MRRLACINIPAFPLQILLRRLPDWKDVPAAVIAEDKPNAPVLWMNTRARQKQIVSGMRYSAALSLAGDLRAAVIPMLEIQAEIAKIQERLRAHSPHVEAACDEPGIFWLDASGLTGVVKDLETWGWQIRSTLDAQGLYASIAIGFSRFAVYAIARSTRRVTCFQTAEEEADVLDDVDVGHLALPPKIRDALYQLELRTIADIRSLPASGLRKRFGAAVELLHRQVCGEHDGALHPQDHEEAISTRRAWDQPLHNRAAVMRSIQDLMPALIAEHRVRHWMIQRLHIELRFERPPPEFVSPNPQYFTPDIRAFAPNSRHPLHPGGNPPIRQKQNTADDDDDGLIGTHTSVQPATPTLDIEQLLDLCTLRIETLPLPAGVLAIEMWTDALPATQEQMWLLQDNPKRDLYAGNKALARLKAELGEQSVVWARLKDGHLPEAQFTWRVFDQQLRLPAPAAEPDLHQIRRLYDRPKPLPPRPRYERDDGWMAHDTTYGAITQMIGPYIISGGWWRTEIHRTYYYAETHRGDMLWVYFDRRRKRWFLQSLVQ